MRSRTRRTRKRTEKLHRSENSRTCITVVFIGIASSFFLSFSPFFPSLLSSEKYVSRKQKQSRICTTRQFLVAGLFGFAVKPRDRSSRDRYLPGLVAIGFLSAGGRTRGETTSRFESSVRSTIGLRSRPCAQAGIVRAIRAKISLEVSCPETNVSGKPRYLGGSLFPREPIN